MQDFGVDVDYSQSLFTSSTEIPATPILSPPLKTPTSVFATTSPSLSTPTFFPMAVSSRVAHQTNTDFVITSLLASPHSQPAQVASGTITSLDSKAKPL
jgi:hypothetical protein